MYIFDWIHKTFLTISGDIDIKIAIVNHEITDEYGNKIFKRFTFANYRELMEWAIINNDKYIIDSDQSLYFNVGTGFTIYVYEIE